MEWKAKQSDDSMLDEESISLCAHCDILGRDNRWNYRDAT